MLAAALLCFVPDAMAQETSAIPDEQPVKTWFISVYGGPSFSINENAREFFYSGNGKDLLNYAQGGITFGKNFSNRYGGRLAFEFGTNDSACNKQQTSSQLFYPYTFNNCALFADWIINGGNVTAPKNFNWRPYFGAGLAYSFGFTDANHPWQYPTTSNLCFAFRYGLILEYIFNERVGIYLDGTHEWFTDNFNGMYPRQSGNGMWHFSEGKHLGFPFDMKINANLGLAIHF